MRLLFAGTPANAASTLDALVASGFEIVGVLTREDAPVGRSKVLTESAVASAAALHRIPTKKSNRVSEEVLDWIKERRPDLGVIVAYGSILRKPALDLPEMGWINLHYSLLPKFPGAAPFQHAILAGESRTGVTVFRLDEGVDTGPILNQAEQQIDPEVNSGELLQELTNLGCGLLVDTLTHLEERISQQQEQVIPVGTTFAGKISRPMAKLNFLHPALVVHNFVRAMNPEPMAWFEANGAQIRVLKTTVSGDTTSAPGEAVVVNGSLLVGCSEGAVELIQVQPAGKNEMSGVDWFRGLRQESISVL